MSHAPLLLAHMCFPDVVRASAAFLLLAHMCFPDRARRGMCCSLPKTSARTHVLPRPPGRNCMIGFTYHFRSHICASPTRYPLCRRPSDPPTSARTHVLPRRPQPAGVGLDPHIFRPHTCASPTHFSAREKRVRGAAQKHRPLGGRAGGCIRPPVVRTRRPWPPPKQGRGRSDGETP